MPLKVLFVPSGLGTGGAERTLVRLCPALRRRGIDVAVLALRGGPIVAELLESDVPTTALGMPGWLGGLVAMRTARKQVATFAPDVIHGWMYHGCLAATVLQRSARLAWSIRQSSERDSLTRLSTRGAHGIARLLSHRADAIVYNSMHARATHEAAGFDSLRAHVILNGFENQKVVDRRQARTALGLAEDAFVVGNVERWHPVKDHYTLIHAFALVAQRCPRAQLLLVGEGIDQGTTALHQIIRREGVADRTRLLGARRDLDVIYSALDVHCLSSRSEAFPNVVAEAMSAGVPCVSTSVGDAAILIADTGFIVAPGDPRALSDALLRVEQLPEQQRTGLGRAAARRIQEHYGLDSVADSYVTLYRSLLG
jgi:glycosyltransferase involved in cell wall biosynthesis